MLTLLPYWQPHEEPFLHAFMTSLRELLEYASYSSKPVRKMNMT